MASIWKQALSVDSLTQIHRGTWPEHLGIEFLEVGDDFIRARIPVDARVGRHGHPVMRTASPAPRSGFKARWRLVAPLFAIVASQPASLSNATEPVRGVFGVTIAVSADGLFNPVVQAARVSQVQPGLPASAAGIVAGDEVLEVDGKRVPGSTARDLAPLAKGKRVGETVLLTLSRPNGSRYTVNLVAVEPSK